jgi:hypothetical protein
MTCQFKGNLTVGKKLTVGRMMTVGQEMTVERIWGNPNPSKRLAF